MTDRRRTIMTAALTVAAGAGVATAHGLYQVAAAARVTAPIAWLYPLITDGLALVAYAAAARLHDRGRRYAAGIVILAAGLSGTAQAVYLAGALDHSAAPVGLRAGVGAWPAIAAALTAHLLHLIAGERTTDRPASNPAPAPPVDTDASKADVHSRTTPADPVQPPVRARLDTQPGRTANRTARDRARAAAQRHHEDHGHLPTVNELARIAGVARGTAGNALKELRAERPALHLVNADTDDRTDR